MIFFNISINKNDISFFVGYTKSKHLIKLLRFPLHVRGKKIDICVFLVKNIKKKVYYFTLQWLSSAKKLVIEKVVVFSIPFLIGHFQDSNRYYS